MAEADTATTQSPEFTGSKAVKTVAESTWRIYQMRGAFFSVDAPIRLTVDEIVEFHKQLGESVKPKQVQSALSANDHVFQKDESDETLAFITTRRGVPPAASESNDDEHDLRERFTTPEPPREHELLRRADSLKPRLEQDAEGGSIEPEYPADSWQAAVAAALRDAAPQQDDSVTSVETSTAETPASTSVGAILDDLGIDADDTGAVDTTDVEETEHAEGAVASGTDESVAPTAPEVEHIDPAEVDETELAAAIEAGLNETEGIVRWGNTWMAEDAISRLSRGDIRRLQEFLAESDEALSDVDLVQDLRGILPNAEEFEAERFALNYRMSQEEREFEFVGTADLGLWTSAGLKPLGTDKRRASEIGQDYRFLHEFTIPDEQIEEGIVEHVLTFYEFNLGVLPLDANMTTLMPGAAFNNQRATRLTFESPQNYETFEIELRYPTSNRGGYLIGFEKFFEANLVPGAVLTIESTDSPTHFIIEFFQISRQDRKLLQFDDRRNAFVFKQTTYYCATQDDMLLDENHFERLANVEPLSEGIRRNPEQVVAATFERIGERENSGGDARYMATFTDLLAASNIERPVNPALLRHILTSGEYPQFSVADEDGDLFNYAP
ncbi:MAG: hypothetical protein ACOC9Y_00570 [Chloroflexota bacterium]